MTDPSVEQAIQRVKDGHLAAYEVVVNAYQARLRAVLAGVCPPGVDPDEIAHHAFVEAFRKIDGYAAGTNFFAWLAAIGRTQVLMELRRQRNEARKHESYARQLVTEAVESELAGEALDESRVDHLRDCLGHLPERLRALLEMRYAQGAPLGTIADRIGKTVAAVKFQLFDIRRKLRDCVDRKVVAEGTGRAGA